MFSATLLCTPQYKGNMKDRQLTAFFRRLVEGLAAPLPESFTHVEFDTPISFREVVRSHSLGRDTILIFAGHGNESALLGPTLTGTTGYSIFYDSTLLNFGPRSLLAFCCSSATLLGRQFKESISQTYLGFLNKMMFITVEGEPTDWWRYIFQSIANQVMADAKVSLTVKELADDVYQQAYIYFRYGEGSNHEWAPLIANFLYDQKQALCVFSDKLPGVAP